MPISVLSSTSARSCRLPAVWRIAGLFLLMLVLRPAASAQAQTWLVSTAAQIKLGIEDKYGQLGPYAAVFVVRNEKTGKEYFLTKQLEKGQTGTTVPFPSEPTDQNYFKTTTGEGAKALPGRYVWECRVGGKKAVGGRFVFPEVSNDVTIIQK